MTTVPHTVTNSASKGSCDDRYEYTVRHTSALATTGLFSVMIV